MKKIVLLLVIGMMSLSLVACGDDKGSDDIWDKEESEIGEASSKNNEKIVKKWINDVINDLDYEKQFDTSVYEESGAQKCKDILNQELKLTVFYANEDVIMSFCRSVDNQILGVVALARQDDMWRATSTKKMETFLSGQICNNCNGTGILPDEKKCAICKGEGIFVYTGSDVDLGLDEDNHVITGITIKFANKLIADFVSKESNTFNLLLGWTHTPSASTIAGSGGYVFTSNSDVVTVNSKGKVTAVGEGTAYVIISTDDLKTYEVYMYNVGEKALIAEFDKLIKNFVPKQSNTYTLSVGNIHKPSAAVWIGNGRGAAYSSDENVVTISEYGIVSAVGKGTAYIVIMPSLSLYEVYQYIVE